MEDAQAPAARLTFVLRCWTHAGAARARLYLLFRRGPVGILPSGQTALRLHGALQKEEQRPGAGGQRAGSSAVDVRVQLSVRGLQRERPERDGPRAAGAAQRRQQRRVVAAHRHDWIGSFVVSSAASTSRPAPDTRCAEVSAAGGGAPDALDSFADADAQQTDCDRRDSYHLSQPAISSADLVS